MVQDRTGSLKPFMRDRLFIDIYESCKHRSASANDASALTQVVIDQLAVDKGDGILRRGDIVSLTVKVLGRFDQTAAAVYAAYHPEMP